MTRGKRNTDTSDTSGLCPECHKSYDEFRGMIGETCDVCQHPMGDGLIRAELRAPHHFHYQGCENCGTKVKLHASVDKPEHAGYGWGFRREVGMPCVGRQVGRLHAITSGVLTYRDQRGQVKRVIVLKGSTVTLALIHFRFEEASS